MSYNILGINTSHNGSVCVLVDGKIDFFLEEDRITRMKHDSIPTKLLSYISQKYNIDEVAISGVYDFPFKGIGDEFLVSIISKYFLTSPKTLFLDRHHTTHTSISFFNSNFKEAIGIVIDGAGTKIKNKWETESVYKLSYKQSPIPIYKSYRNNDEPYPLVSFNRVYDNITEYLGFVQFCEAGKTMGLSSYGKLNSNIPPLYIKGKGNPEVFTPILNTPSSKLSLKSKTFFDNNDNKQFKFDLAYHVQQESQKYAGDLIEKAIQETGIKQVCCSGGYFLNCVANYYLTKRFPDVEFYFEPISSDAGNAIGAAKLLWYQSTQDKTIRPQKTIYYGPKYSKEDLLNGIQKYLD